MHTPVITLTRAAANTIAAEAPVSADGKETGGILLGHDRSNVATTAVHVTTAGDPGPNADRRGDRFLRDLRHARTLADDAYASDRSVWIGEWHTHPSGSLAPSTIDLETYERLLRNPELNFQWIASLIVVPCYVHGWTEPTIAAWIATFDGTYRAVARVEAT
jgi:integrative and conjugative element protein (TIGR02256 family)